MKRLNLNKFTLTLILLTAITFRASSQCMVVPVSLDYRVNRSSTIIEGTITGERTTWDDEKKKIFTVYTIDVTSVFKGNAAGTIEVATWGGTVGDITMKSSNNIKAGKGNAGIFMLYPSKHHIASRSTVYECLTDVQGFLKYNRSERSASGVFDKYASVENNLYPLLESKTGRARQVRKAFSWETSENNNTGTQRGAAGNTSSGNNDLAHSITTFSPTTTTAGTGSVLTITGSGFGSSRGTSYVEFRDADKNDDYMSASSYSSWSDTEIKVKVPSGAGTGKVRVVVNGTTKTSSNTLTINYNLISSGNTFLKLTNDNGNGGYTFSMRSDFASSSGGSVFRTALQQWICNAGMNWTISGTNTSTDEVAIDGINVVRWDNKGELTGGTLGLTTSYYNACGEAYEIDITFDTEETDWWEINVNGGLVWYYNTSGNCPSGKYDFYSVALHELGHACGQGHVIKSGDMMHYKINDGQDNEDFVQDIEIAGGQDAVNRSLTAYCSSPLTKMYCSSPTVTLSTGASSISENGSTTVTATLSTAYYDTVYVTLGLSGTATVSTDYTLSTSLTIPPGATSASTTLSSVNDSWDEDNETVIIDISSVSGGTESGTQQKTVTINDDDATPTLTLSAAKSSVTEGNGNNFDITATLSAVSGRTVAVYFTHGGTATWNSDYTIFTPAVTNVIYIQPGSLTGTTSFIYINDSLYENSETAIIGIDSINNATENGTQQLSITINDNDTKPTVTLDVAQTMIPETTTQMNFYQWLNSTTITATLSGVSGAATTVNLGYSGTATRGADYTSDLSITIPAGSTSASITLSSILDVLDEDDETVIVDISSVTNATESGTQQKTITILDDDAAPNVTIAWSNTSIGEGPAGTSNAVATLSKVSGKAVTVNLSFSGTATLNSDYTVTGSTINIPAGSTTGYITMNNIPDTLNEGNENATVNISSATNATIGNPSSASMTINDDDIPSVSIAWSNTSIGEGPAGTSNAVVTLSRTTYLPVTVTLSFSGTATLNSDYTVTGSTIIIPAGSTTGYITMNNIPDTIYEGNENITVDIATVTNAKEVGTQHATMTINDDDAPPTGRSANAVVVPAPKEQTKPVEAVANATAGPNPFSTQLTVRNLAGGSILQLADMNGVIITTLKADNSTMTLNTSSLKAGAYFLTINSADGKRQTIKLLKQ